MLPETKPDVFVIIRWVCCMTVQLTLQCQKPKVAFPVCNNRYRKLFSATTVVFSNIMAPKSTLQKNYLYSCFLQQVLFLGGVDRTVLLTLFP